MTANTVDAVELAKAGVDTAPMAGTTKEQEMGKGHMDVHAAERSHSVATQQERYEDTPTEEELQTLRRVSGKIPWSAYTIAFVELCERFSYYGSSVVYTNFVRGPLPKGSKTGAITSISGDDVPGALDMGQKAAQGINLFNSFWAYIMPLVGAYIADAHLGRYKTIHIAIAVSLVAHVILTASAAPATLENLGAAKGVFILGVISLGVGTGFFKANISPLLAEQNLDTRMRVETLPKTGERVIVDPAVTNTRIFLYFYFCINVGSLVGQIGMVFAEKYVGFWLSYTLPTVLFILCPIVLTLFRKTYITSPPTGSVLSKFMHMSWYAFKQGGYKPKNFTWDSVRPQNVLPEHRPTWMTYDDAWVDQVRRGIKACKVFLFLPLFFLAYNQMTGNLTSQAATMELHGAPNDLIQNLNPISILIFIPFLDHVVYPGMRKMGFNFTPIKRMTVGFFLSALSMIAAAVLQHFIYQKSACGKYAGECDTPAPINVWAQVMPYVLIGFAEIFTNVTSYEYAFSKAPENMRSLVMAFNLFQSAFSAAVGQAFTPLSGDPLLVWNYVVICVLAFAGGVGFWFCFKDLDKDEDKWNSIAHSAYRGKSVGGDVSHLPKLAETQSVGHEKV